MTPAEIQALIDANELALTILEADLKEAIAKVKVDAWFAAIAAIKVEYDATDITAVQAEYNLKILI